MAKRTPTTAALAAKAIRTEIKALGIKAKVKSENYSMGDSVDIYVTDLSPNENSTLNNLASKYQEGHFDGMHDIYEYSNLDKNIPQVKYVFVKNSCSDEMKQKIWDYLRNKYTGNFSGFPEGFDTASNLVDDGFNLRVSEIVYRYFRGGYSCNEFWENN